MNIEILRTDSKNQNFINLIKELDAFLAITDGDEHGFYDQYNKTDAIKNVLVLYVDGVAVGCGSIKEYDADIMEVKRMFTKEEFRGLGLASKILKELEIWTKELGYEKCILETGKRQVEAISLYQKNNYTIIPNYGQYAEVENSVCFEKSLRAI